MGTDPEFGSVPIYQGKFLALATTPAPISKWATPPVPRAGISNWTSTLKCNCSFRAFLGDPTLTHAGFHRFREGVARSTGVVVVHTVNLTRTTPSARIEVASRNLTSSRIHPASAEEGTLSLAHQFIHTYDDPASKVQFPISQGKGVVAASIDSRKRTIFARSAAFVNVSTPPVPELRC